MNFPPPCGEGLRVGVVKSELFIALWRCEGSTIPKLVVRLPSRTTPTPTPPRKGRGEKRLSMKPHFAMMAGYNAWCNERIYDVGGATLRCGLPRGSRGVLQVGARHPEPSSRHRPHLAEALLRDRAKRRTGSMRSCSRTFPSFVRRARGRTSGSSAISTACPMPIWRDASATRRSRTRPRSSSPWRRLWSISSTIRPIIAGRSIACSPASASRRRRSISSCSSARPGSGLA